MRDNSNRWAFLGWALREHGLEALTEAGVRVDVCEDAGRLSLYVRIDKNTTREALENSWWQILQWRDALKEWQGRRMLGRDATYLQLWSLFERGLSYSEIAKRVNETILGYLHDHVSFAAEWQSEERPHFETVLDYLTWCDSQELDPWAFEHADDLLSDIRPGLTDEARRELLDEIVHEIEQGYEPFPPVERQNIIDRLKTFEPPT